MAYQQTKELATTNENDVKVALVKSVERYNILIILCTFIIIVVAFYFLRSTSALWGLMMLFWTRSADDSNIDEVKR